MTAVSVLVPSRGRVAALEAAEKALLDLADLPGEVEFLVALDPDDPDLYSYVDSLPDGQFWVAGERYGYTRLHEYYNHLAEMAAGDWLLVYNDDARMLTPGWDTIITNAPPGVLKMQANHNGGGNLFPAFPAAWAKALGCVSPFPHPDVWLLKVAEILGCHYQIPVEVLHDRADVTGGHDDQTYAEGRKLLGEYGMCAPFPHDEAAGAAEVIRQLGIELTIKERL